MKNLLLSTLALFLTAAALIAGPMLLAPPQAGYSLTAVKLAGCPCPEAYAFHSTSALLAGIEDYVELDSDNAVPETLALPANPSHLERHEVWMTNQPALPAGPWVIDPNGKPTRGADLVLDQVDEGRLLLFVQPPSPLPGYWRVTALDCCTSPED